MCNNVRTTFGSGVLSAPAVATVGLEQPVGGREYTLTTVVQNFMPEVGATIEDSFW